MSAMHWHFRLEVLNLRILLRLGKKLKIWNMHAPSYAKNLPALSHGSHQTEQIGAHLTITNSHVKKSGKICGIVTLIGSRSYDCVPPFFFSNIALVVLWACVFVKPRPVWNACTVFTYTHRAPISCRYEGCLVSLSCRALNQYSNNSIIKHEYSRVYFTCRDFLD